MFKKYLSLSVTCCYSSGQTGGVCKKRFIWQKPGPRNLQYTDNTAEHLPFTSQGTLCRDHIASMNSKQGTVCLTYVLKNARKRAWRKELFDTKRQTETDRHGALWSQKDGSKLQAAVLLKGLLLDWLLERRFHVFWHWDSFIVFMVQPWTHFTFRSGFVPLLFSVGLAIFFQLERFLKSH